jgi:hypothetical protein
MHGRSSFTSNISNHAHIFCHVEIGLVYDLERTVTDDAIEEKKASPKLLLQGAHLNQYNIFTADSFCDFRGLQPSKAVGFSTLFSLLNVLRYSLR